MSTLKAVSTKRTYPFVAIVGQEEMKRALLLAAIDSNLGGVLLFGERGTGKTTAVRGLRDILPPIETTDGNEYNELVGSENTVSIKRPLIDLPLGVTEDRLLGSIHLEHAIKKGEKVFEPGLLAKANRGLLYIDEVNLLEDSIVDLLLDVAASKENIVEREGISVRHPAEFVLIGSCNPEEGELRPQLLDRFGLSVQLKKEDNTKERADVVRRRLQFEDDAEEFVALFERTSTELREQLTSAINILESVIISDQTVERATRIAQYLGLEGHRAELAMVRAARSLAAFEGRLSTTADDVDAVAPMCLRHRIKSHEPTLTEKQIQDALESI
ncbi:MAG TPA: ATP-binding protein [Candidatus Kapabacteria bacterium]